MTSRTFQKRKTRKTLETTMLAWIFAIPLVACIQIGDKSTSSDDGGTPSCGTVKVRAPKWSATCQSWLDTNCCSQQGVCNADVGCAELLACVNGCIASEPDTCVASCKGKALSESIARYDAIGSCAGSLGDEDAGSATVPNGCSWP